MTQDVNKGPGVFDPSADEGYERLARLYRYAQVGRCVSSVTHDLNNFLGAIMAYAELISMDTPMQGESARMLGEIVDGVKKCSGLVNDLTAIARKERRDVSLVNLTQMIRRTLNLRRYDFRVAQIDLFDEIDGELGDVIVDRPRIEQALIYLVNNALEAALAGEKGAVTLRASRNGERFRITLCNAGPAIADDVRARMFEPFFTTKSNEHVGLGLTVAAKTLEYHEGSLTYDPEHGFVMDLPRTNHLARDLEG